MIYGQRVAAPFNIGLNRLFAIRDFNTLLYMRDIKISRVHALVKDAKSEARSE